MLQPPSPTLVALYTLAMKIACSSCLSQINIQEVAKNIGNGYLPGNEEINQLKTGGTFSMLQ
jgi:hypothetical protein